MFSMVFYNLQQDIVMFHALNTLTQPRDQIRLDIDNASPNTFLAFLQCDIEYDDLHGRCGLSATSSSLIAVGTVISVLMLLFCLRQNILSAFSWLVYCCPPQGAQPAQVQDNAGSAAYAYDYCLRRKEHGHGYEAGPRKDWTSAA